MKVYYKKQNSYRKSHLTGSGGFLEVISGFYLSRNSAGKRILDLRLKRNKDFQFLFNRGNRSHKGSVTMIYHKSRELKIGYSVSKKHGKSVQRNRIKRLLRAAFNTLKKDIDKKVYIVIIPSVRESYRYDVFLKDMKYLFEKEGLISKKQD